MAFGLAEDEALRDYLLHMSVSDDKNPNRPVGVWFGQPDLEIRSQHYPYITINMIDMQMDTERMMVGLTDPWYHRPEDVLPDEGWDAEFPVPMNLDYQLSVFSRQPRHDRQIMSQLMRRTVRYGSVLVKHGPEIPGETPDDPPSYDATVRRLDLLGVSKRDYIESGKRVFMNAVTVRISSEVPSLFYWRYHKVLRVIGTTKEVGADAAYDNFTLT